MKKILITGGLGFIGVNTALKLSMLGYECTLVDNFYRNESKKNKKLIKNIDLIKFINLDVTEKDKVEKLIKENQYFAVFNFAGQVAMSDSLQNPMIDFNINAYGSLCLLESIRKYSKETIYLYTSSNKVYGDLNWDKVKTLDQRYESVNYKNGYGIDIPINLTTPYGCSKGVGDLYSIDYYKSFGVKTIVLRLSTIYGKNQTSTYNQGWIGWFISEAINKKNNETIEILGSGKQVRDVLNVDDLTNLFEIVIESSENFVGNVYNVGGGYNNSISLLELISYLKTSLEKNFKVIKLDSRISDQKYYVSDISKLNEISNWKPEINKYDGIENNIAFIKKQI